MNQQFEKILNFLLHPENSPPEILRIISILKIIFIIFGLFFLGFTIWGAIFTEYLWRLFIIDLKEFLTYKPYEIKKFTKKWEKIKKRLKSGIEADAKLAILEADSLLDQFLAIRKYQGKNLEEKLENLTEEILPSLPRLKQAIKVRNAIVEDPSYKLDREEAERTLEIYEQALKDLQAI